MAARMDDFLRYMFDKGGSDLHLLSNHVPKIRKSGNLVAIEGEGVIGPDEMEGILKEICPDAKWKQYVENFDLDFAYEITGVARFRVNYMRTVDGMASVMRTIPTEIMTMEQLNLPDTFKGVVEQGSGLILVTGPTGSGKSTTLAAMINHINETQSKHIITIEDPLEFVHPNKESVIVQREVHDHTTSFNIALKGAMRADPDIVLVGEMRDPETIGLALSCAAMGLMVFGTLHTNNAPKTVDRIIGAFPAKEQPQIRAMLASTLRTIISQLLCKTTDGKRCASHEVLLFHPALPGLIREGKLSSIRGIIEAGVKQGMKTMDMDLLRLYKEGRISGEEAYMKAAEKAAFQEFLPAGYFDDKS
ncbi:PilT/PilU family type 4a pilus ATPase [Lentisphaera marina]|uniref:type IV pilus twitching motility protein PilT n=1 Tax=Lentisphaera marina TaxID=1111041 RepID=UPI0023653C07|nr:PilT/PilU family type 4a pilus ATPase [Lentisphaera marina]MDD7983759.1 PilT/PilU family type 4a pilus ATPase [Lentisphaera marina]